MAKVNSKALQDLSLAAAAVKDAWIKGTSNMMSAMQQNARHQATTTAKQMLARTAAAYGLKINPVDYTTVAGYEGTKDDIVYRESLLGRGATNRDSISWEREGADVEYHNVMAGFVQQMSSEASSPAFNATDYSAKTKAALDDILATIQNTSPSVSESETAYMNRRDEVAKLRMRGIGRFLGQQPLSPITNNTGTLDTTDLEGE